MNDVIFGDVGERLTNFLLITQTFQPFNNVPHVPKTWKNVFQSEYKERESRYLGGDIS